MHLVGFWQNVEHHELQNGVVVTNFLGSHFPYTLPTTIHMSFCMQVELATHDGPHGSNESTTNKRVFSMLMFLLFPFFHKEKISHSSSL